MAESDAAAAGLERKLATILSADVVAYSRLMAEDEERTLQTFRAHKEIFEKLVEQHRGRVFNTAGDAILAEFSSAVEAVRCATEIQSGMARVSRRAAGSSSPMKTTANLGFVR
jgi:class 3 adenylate cyclase